jgi:undecaprenyl-diphosphatase
VAGYFGALLTGVLLAAILQRQGDWTLGLAWEREFLLSTRVRFVDPIDSLFLLLPWLGTNITLIPIVIVVSLWLTIRRARPDLALYLIVVQMGSFTLNALLKEIIDRPRPALWELRGQHAWASFPSGHAIASVSVLLTVALLLRQERGWRWPLWVATILLLFSLYSRLYLGVHWPTDVLAGVAVGLIWLIATYVAFARRSVWPTAAVVNEASPASPESSR